MQKKPISYSFLGLLTLATSAAVLAAGETITVYKNPSCTCCTKWVDALREGGYRVKNVDTSVIDEIKSSAGVKPELASCHTAMVDGYVIEGHVPPADISRLLKERPAVKGLAVPGMPKGTPGMEAQDPEHYQVLSIGQDGSTAVFAEH